MTSRKTVGRIRSSRRNLAVLRGAIPEGDVRVSFEDNLLALGPPPNITSSVTQIVIANTIRTRALAVLNRMNISRATLFPGLDGFAQSLGINVQVATNEGTLRRGLQQLSIYTEWGFL